MQKGNNIAENGVIHEYAYVHNLFEREKAIELIKSEFTKNLISQLDLVKVSSPIAVLDGTGINDDLTGIERAVSFPVKFLNNRHAVVVHSLAKWKRIRLKELSVPANKGILTDMKALRPDEDYSPIHSIYVDQWDWEVSMENKDRHLSFLKKTVNKIYEALLTTEAAISGKYRGLEPTLPKKVHYIHAEELLKLFPNLTPKQREDAICKQFGAVFLIGIGAPLSDGLPHDHRSPDYDDWSTKNDDGYVGLNGDLLVWNPIFQKSFELSSMGIRVNKEALNYQLVYRKCYEKSELYYHKLLLSNQLPQSIGGGIGQSRVCMFLLRLRHIGEVQAGIWSEEVINKAKAEGIFLL